MTIIGAASTFLVKYQEMNQQEPTVSLKEEVRSILRDYRNFWDVHAELLQNAVDAINRRYRLLNDPSYYLYESFQRENIGVVEQDYRGKISIKIDTTTNTLTVLDNGVGIQRENLLNFLLPKYSGKKLRQDYGFKGYGLTFVAFISRNFMIGSRFFTERVPYQYEVNDIFDWIASEDKPFPVFPNIADQSDDSDLQIGSEWNTKIQVRLDHDYQRRFDAVAALDVVSGLISNESDINRLKYILRTKTAIGNTKGLFSQPSMVPIDITLEVKLPNGELKKTEIEYSYSHPNEFDEVSVQAYEFADYATQVRAAHFTRGFRALTHTIQDYTIGSRTPIKCNICITAVSATRLGKLEQQIGLDVMEDPSARITPGIFLSIDGMPTGIRLDSWDKKGALFKRYYVLVDAALDLSNTLDSGRKGITSHYARLIDEEVVKLINSVRIGDSDTFGNYATRDLDVGRGRGPAPDDPDFDEPEFKKDVDVALEKISGDETNYRNLVEKVRKYSPLLGLPHSEQEVVALFYSLLSQGYIKGYKVVYQAGSEKVYDAAYTFSLDLDGNTEPQDPLGFGRVIAQRLKSSGRNKYDHSNHYAGRTTYAQLCVEFKSNVGGLLFELQRISNKEPFQIDILVVWDTSIPSQVPSNTYTLANLVDNPSQRLYHSTTHRLGITGARNTDIDVISLKDVLEKLPN